MLHVKNISFGYHNDKTIDTINFDLISGTTLAIIGESGCGKSTLLKLIYGLYDLDEGEILWNEMPVFGPKQHLIPGMEFMKYLAQDFDLMPFTTVAENVGKFLSNTDPEEKKGRIATLLEVVEMTDFAQIKVKFLSGGQMQRVAIAKVLAQEPEVLLLDEPFSHIDNFRKNKLRRHLFSYLKSKKITTIIATHDTKDILSFADEVVVLKDGKLIEKANTKQCYYNKKNQYIASLFGDVNTIKASYFFDNDDSILLVYPHELQEVKHSKFKTVVTNCFFEGNNYLIESQDETTKYYFASAHFIENNTVVFLDLTSNFKNF